MKQYVYLSVLCLFTLASCTDAFKKGDNGLEYKIISKGNGRKLNYGNFMQLHLSEIYKGAKDTVTSDTRDFMPRIIVFDSISTPLPYFKILSQLKKGDSAVIRVLTDSFYKQYPDQMPPFMKKGKYIYTTVKLVNVFDNVAQADSAQKAETVIARPKIIRKQLESIEKRLAEAKPQLDKDHKTISSYLAQNNIKATKTNWGTYIVIQNEGTGNTITRDDVIMVNYTGRTLDSGKVFDSNTDPRFGHVQPYQLAMANVTGVIPGWIDGLMQLKKGSKATFYIPSSLGYGTAGRQPGIKPNDNLVFDMEIVDVEPEETVVKRIQEEQRRTDSLQRAMPMPRPGK